MSTKEKIREDRINEICEKTGWSREKADKKLKKAFKLGIDNFNYIKYEGWDLGEIGLRRIAKKINKKREERIAIICKKTGWDEEKANEELKKAFSLGINNADYIKYEVWDLNDMELKEIIKKIKDRQIRRAERIDIICEKTGWDKSKSDKELKKAYKLGVSNFNYIKYECWKLSEDELKEVASDISKAIEKKKNKRENIISVICEKTGWDRNKVDVELKKAYKLGLNNANYVKYEGWKLSESEIKKIAKMKHSNIQYVADYKGIPFDEAKEEINKIKESYGITGNQYVNHKMYLCKNEEEIEKVVKKIKNKNQFFLKQVCDNTGWTMEKAKKEADRIKNLYGLTYNKYAIKRLYEKTDEEIEEMIQLWSDNLDKYVKIAMRESGWEEDAVRKHIKKCEVQFGIDKSYYVLYKAWNLSDEELSTYACHNDSKILGRKYNGDNRKILIDKLRFNEVFKDYTGRKYWVNSDTSFEEFQEFIYGLDSIFCKPLDASGAFGSERIEVKGNIKDLYNYLMSKNKMLVEECIKQHPDIEEFETGCVNTVRVIALKDKNKRVHIIAVSMKFGNGGIADNLTHNGMVVSVDKKSGVIVTDAIDENGIVYKYHPISNKEFRGFQIPHWSDIINTVTNAMLLKNGINYVGWDVAVCKDKVVLVEGNSVPDLMLIQAPYSPQKKGVRYLFEEYM